MTDHTLFSEVDADVRAERAAALWARYRYVLLSLALALIVGVAAYSVWNHLAEKRGGELLLAFTKAQELYSEESFPEAATAFDAIANQTSGDTKTLARLWQGRALAASDKKPEAIQILASAAKGSSLWADLACLRLASLDSASAADCLTATTDSPLASQRHEWQAAGAWEAGKREEAITILEQLATSPDTAESARGRISAWLATIRAQGVK